MWIGRNVYYLEHFINSRFRGIQRTSAAKDISEKLALEKGV